YTAEELAAVFAATAAEADFAVTDATLAAVGDAVRADPDRYARGNGREVRKLFDEAVARQARRIERMVLAGEDPSIEHLRDLLPEDVAPMRGTGGAGAAAYSRARAADERASWASWAATTSGARRAIQSTSSPS